MGRSAKTRRVKKMRKTTRRQRGAGVNCSNGKNTWSCSAQCGKDTACEKYD